MVEGFGAKKLRQPARSHPPRELHLEIAILRMDESAGACDVADIASTNMRYAALVAADLDRGREPLKLEGALCLRERLPAAIEKVTHHASREEHDDENEEEE